MSTACSPALAGARAQYTQYLDLRRTTTSFAGMAAFSERPIAVGSGESARERRVGLVSASFFTFFASSAVPALRAARVDPNSALRADA